MEYIIKRSHRKTAAIYITKNAEVEVRVPTFMVKNQIENFVNSHINWIEFHTKRRKDILSKANNNIIDYSSTIHLEGNEYIISPYEDFEKFPPKFKDNHNFYVLPNLTPEEIRQYLIASYKDYAKKYLLERAFLLSKSTDLIPEGIKISSAKTRWGSCSGKKNINLSWRLVMGDKSCWDYVIIHELCHLKEMNHSPNFWAMVERFCPDYKERKKQLKKLQLFIEESGLSV